MKLSPSDYIKTGFLVLVIPCLTVLFLAVFILFLVWSVSELILNWFKQLARAVREFGEFLED